MARYRNKSCEVDVATIRARLAAATPGPWWSEDDDDSWNLYGGGAPVDGWSAHGSKILKAPKHGTPYAEYWPNDADADLITHAPADLADLCDEVETVRAVRDWYRDQHAAVATRLAAKDAEIKRLRKALEQIAFPPLRVTGDIETVDEYDPAGVAAAALADGEATG